MVANITARSVSLLSLLSDLDNVCLRNPTGDLCVEYIPERDLRVECGFSAGWELCKALPADKCPRVVVIRRPVAHLSQFPGADRAHGTVDSDMKVRFGFDIANRCLVVACFDPRVEGTRLCEPDKPASFSLVSSSVLAKSDRGEGIPWPTQSHARLLRNGSPRQLLEGLVFL